MTHPASPRPVDAFSTTPRRGLSLLRRVGLFAGAAAAATVFLASSPAAAAPKDASSEATIKQAIDNDYLALKLDDAEAKLKGVISGCAGGACSPAVLAKAYMYMGLIRGSGRKDLAGAKDNFTKALQTDPNVKLDEGLATEETKAAFAEAKQSVPAGGGTQPGIPVAPPAPSPTPSATPTPTPAPTGVVGVNCTPEVTEVSKRQPVPFACTSDEADVASAELRLMGHGASTWTTVKMKKVGNQWQARTPCSAVEFAGDLRWYVAVKDKDGEILDTQGTKREPNLIKIVTKSSQPAPHLSGVSAPTMCAEKVECPPDLPGCESGGDKDWGASCGASSECKAGLACIEGTCQDSEGTEGTDDAPAAKFKRHYISLNIGADLVVTGGENACGFNHDSDFACFARGGDLPYVTNGDSITYPTATLPSDIPDAGNRVSDGVAFGQIRFMLGYDFAIIPNLTVGGLLGGAILGGPAPAGGNAFLPLHAAAKVKYYPIGLDQKTSFLPYVALTGGLAQFDAKSEITVKECAVVQDARTTNQPEVIGQNDPRFTQCANGNFSEAEAQAYVNQQLRYRPQQVDAWKKLGQAFAGLAVGSYFPIFGDAGGLNAEVNVFVTFPDTGLVLEPTIGYQIGL